MSRLVSLQLFLFVVEAAWIIVGSVWTFHGNKGCDETINKSRALVIVGYAWIGLYIMKQLCMADPAGCLCSHSSDGSDRYWEKCCRVVCCCADVNNGDRGLVLDIARMFSTAFANTGIAGRMVVTDFAAAMALVQLHQEHEEREHNSIHDVAFGDRPYSGVLGKQENPIVSLKFDPQQQQQQQPFHRDSCYYMKYALAAYGWPLLMFMNLGTGLCRLAPNCHCTCCRTHTTPSDNCLECHTSAILYQTGLNEDELIHVTFINKNGELPYFVAVDREKGKIIVSIRGTMSINDAMTDINAKPVLFGEPDKQLYAHQGIFKSASIIKTQLEQRDSEEPGILQKAFDYAKRVDSNTDYQLVIVGHSLGAGAASILSLLWKVQNEYPDLVCFSYSPPGGLLSIPAVELSKEFTTSVVLGKDMVPRLSLHNAYKLLNDMRNKAVRNISPKWLVQLRCFCACCSKCCKAYKVLTAEDDDDDTVQTLEADTERSPVISPRTTYYSRLPDQEAGPLLYPPGNIIYLVEVIGPQGQKAYHPFLTDYREFHTLFIGASMVDNHLPDRVYNALCQFCPMELR
jgi:sn1-specific diacylglycerol lipase